MINQYHIIAGSKEYVETTVEEALDDGWDLHGPTFATGVMIHFPEASDRPPYTKPEFAQAMIREGDLDDER